MGKTLFQNKVALFLASILIIGFVILAGRAIFMPRVYFYYGGIDVPIANKSIKMTHLPPCHESPCGPETEFVVHTQDDGSVRHFGLSYKKIDKEHNAYEPIYAYFFENYERTHHFKDPKEGRRKDTVFLSEILEPDSDGNVDLILNQMVLIPRKFYAPRGGTHYKFQLVDIQNGSIEIDIQTFGKIVLEKNVPTYIPGEVFDTQVVLTDLTFNKTTIQMLYSCSMVHISERLRDFDKWLEPYDYKYQEALDAFNKIDNSDVDEFFEPFKDMFPEDFQDVFSKIKNGEKMVVTPVSLISLDSEDAIIQGLAILPGEDKCYYGMQYSYKEKEVRFSDISINECCKVVGSF